MMIIRVADFADRLFEPMKYETQAEKRREQMKVFDIAEMEEVSKYVFSTHYCCHNFFSISS